MSDKYPEVQRMLVISTLHISPQADRLLHRYEKESEWCPLSHQSIMYGWLIWTALDDPSISRETQAWAKAVGLEGLAECLQKAVQMRCEWLKLDADAGADLNLPRFEWD